MNVITDREHAVVVCNTRRHAVKIGFALGIFAAMTVCIGIGLTLDLWRVATFERRAAALSAPISAELAECRVIVRDLAEDEYATVLAYYRQIEAKR